MKVRQLIELLKVGSRLNPNCEVFMDSEAEPCISWDDNGDCIIYEGAK